MKKLNLILMLWSITLVANAQHLAIPRTEYELGLPNDVVRIHRGDSAAVTLYVLKSKGYAKAKTALRMSSELPKGVQASITPESGVFDNAIVKIHTSKESEPGKVSLVISAEMRHVPKGAVLTFEIL